MNINEDFKKVTIHIDHNTPKPTKSLTTLKISPIKDFFELNKTQKKIMNFNDFNVDANGADMDKNINKNMDNALNNFNENYEGS